MRRTIFSTTAVLVLGAFIAATQMATASEFLTQDEISVHKAYSEILNEAYYSNTDNSSEADFQLYEMYNVNLAELDSEESAVDYVAEEEMLSKYMEGSSVVDYVAEEEMLAKYMEGSSVVDYVAEEEMLAKYMEGSSVVDYVAEEEMLAKYMEGSSVVDYVAEEEMLAKYMEGSSDSDYIAENQQSFELAYLYDESDEEDFAALEAMAMTPYSFIDGLKLAIK